MLTPMEVIEHQKETQANSSFLVADGLDFNRARFREDMLKQNFFKIPTGSVVLLIGEIDKISIQNLFILLSQKVIVALANRSDSKMFEYYKSTIQAEFVLNGSNLTSTGVASNHHLIAKLRNENSGGLILFSTGTTGQPKAILHSLKNFLIKYQTPRPALRTIGFLNFDHIGGVNTLLHVLYNNGVVVVPRSRIASEIIRTTLTTGAELLPTTPTFIRLLILSGSIEKLKKSNLKVVTYGTERMDQSTLSQAATALPEVDFRQTYGMSELGIMRIKSESRESLFMKIGGEGVTTKIDNESQLLIKSDSRMVGYLNAPNPFDNEGWYLTGDQVETKGEFIRIVGRKNNVINVGGLKVLPGEIESVALEVVGVAFARALGIKNPITGEHVELEIEVQDGFDEETIRQALVFSFSKLQEFFRPKRIHIKKTEINSRFKRN